MPGPTPKETVKLRHDRFEAKRKRPEVLRGPMPMERVRTPLPDRFARMSRSAMLNAILDLPSPEQAVRSLPSAELHYLVHHIGIEDAGVLVPATTDDQFRSLVDLDLWVGDELKPERFERWLWTIDEFGAPGELAHRVASIDDELLVSLLKRWARVHLREDKDEDPVLPDAAVVFSTPDQRYFIEILEPGSNDRFPVLFRLIGALYEDDVEHVIQLLDEVTTEVPGEIDDEARRFRWARMEDLGYVRPDEAALVRAYLDPAAARQGLSEALQGTPHKVTRNEGPPIGTALMSVGGARCFLFDVLGRLTDPDEQEQLVLAFGYLCNRGAALRRLDLSEIEALDEDARLTFRTLDIGLSYLTDCDGDMALEVLRRVELVSIHRVGVSLQTRLARHAAELLEPLGGPEALHVFDPPYDDVLAGLLNEPPLYPEALDNPASAVMRPFESLGELRAVKDLVQAARVAAETFTRRVGLAAVLPSSGDDEAPQGEHADTRLSSLWLTLLAGGVPLAPVPAAAAESWAATVLADAEDEEAALNALEAAGRGLLDRLSVHGPRQRAALQHAVLGPAAQRLVDALYGAAAPYDRHVLADLFMLADQELG